MTISLAGALAVAGLSVSPARAGSRDPIQRQDLALIQTDLQRIDRVIDRLAARQARQPATRTRLDVRALRGDVDRIRGGIRDYLSPPRLAPRHPAPVTGHYRDSNDDTP